jgi:hypothetical protein
MSAFEDFVNLELPRRPALLTYEITGYQGDPNDGGAPAILQGAPKGTFYLRNTDQVLWRKAATGTTTWVVVGGSGSSTWTAASPGSEVVGDFVYISAANTIAKCDITDINKLPVAGVITEKAGGTATIQTVGSVSLFTGLTPGKLYFLGINGVLSATLPTGTQGQALWRQTVGTALNATTIILIPDSTLMGYQSA